MPDAYYVAFAYGEITDCVGHGLYHRTLMAAKHSAVLSVAVDEGAWWQSYMVVCDYYLNHRMEPTISFWEALRVPAKDHGVLLHAVADPKNTCRPATTLP